MYWWPGDRDIELMLCPHELFDPCDVVFTVLNIRSMMQVQPTPPHVSDGFTCAAAHRNASQGDVCQQACEAERWSISVAAQSWHCSWWSHREADRRVSGPASDDACALATCLRKQRAAGSLHPRSALQPLPQAQAGKSNKPTSRAPVHAAQKRCPSGCQRSPAGAPRCMARTGRRRSTAVCACQKNGSRGAAGAASCSRSSSPPQQMGAAPAPVLPCQPPEEPDVQTAPLDTDALATDRCSNRDPHTHT